MANAVDINNLSFEYEEGTKTIDHISFSVPKGSYTVVLGHMVLVKVRLQN